ncbi:uncharacterized protein LOC127137738 [Lathyrus oleraceus]|uniref:uncharacterized protein LOC127137738 n=1 Tax=Pisum sativum TaxID=3888 RepID=UPI0021D0E3C5|nr:uncharacterized protein LOC127137738 [Pisum sativum]
MGGSMVIDTSANGLVTNLLVCLNYPLTIFERDFGIDLVCFPLRRLEVILGMNWLEFNHVFINCSDKSVEFLESKESMELSFMSTRHVEISLSGSAQWFMVFVSLGGGSERMITYLLVVCDFLRCSQMTSVPLEHEVEFVMDSVPGTSLILMPPYKMSTLVLTE